MICPALICADLWIMPNSVPYESRIRGQYVICQVVPVPGAVCRVPMTDCLLLNAYMMHGMAWTQVDHIVSIT